MTDTSTCPSCDVPGFGNAWVVSLELRSGANIEGLVCQTCGTVWVEDPDEAVTNGLIQEQVEGE